MQASPKTFLVSIPIGLAFQLYLFLALISIPVATHSLGHYDLGNDLVGAVFYSYAPFTWRRAGLILFV